MPEDDDPNLSRVRTLPFPFYMAGPDGSFEGGVMIYLKLLDRVC